MKKVIMGIALIVAGVMFMPYIKQMLDALISLADDMFPEMNVTQVFFIHSFPWLVLIGIFIVGGWWIISSLIRRGGSGE